MKNTMNPVSELTIVANINKTALERGILSVANAYHESLVQMYPVLGQSSGSMYFNVKLNGQKYEGQLSLSTTGFSKKWDRQSLNIRARFNQNAKRYIVENCQMGEKLHLTLSTLEPDTFIAKVVE